jgi:hypothetical protein
MFLGKADVPQLPFMYGLSIMHAPTTPEILRGFDKAEPNSQFCG